ncbi:MAG: DUF4238 domain-containing protein [Brumimicrobium sp.]|nr:DUF4238 domain-containing protein [Brumimicrobium sp.]
MGNPERQHFIPRSYLNNFSEKTNGKFFIHATDLSEGNINRLSTKDICVSKNLYTLPDNNEDKFALEYFYAEKIDSVFPEVYNFLKDKDNYFINEEMRFKIITTSLSLYFRTPKFLNFHNNLFENIIKRTFNKTSKDSITIIYAGEEMTINREEIEDIIKEKKENNHIKFLKSHLINYQELVHAKMSDNIAVYHITDESEFITSDNPVIIRKYANPFEPDFDEGKYYSEPINPFDTKNMIHLPIDNKTILSIMPNSVGEKSSFIQRMKIGLYDTIIYNNDIEANMERWILGTKSGVQSHFSNKKQFSDTNTPSNLHIYESYKEKTKVLYKLVETMKSSGLKSQNTKELLIKLLENSSVKSDINLFIYLQRLKETIEK